MRRHAATQISGLCAPSLSISFRGEMSSFSGCADVASYGVVVNNCCAWNAAETQVHVNIMSTPGHYSSLSFDLESHHTTDLRHGCLSSCCLPEP